MKNLGKNFKKLQVLENIHVFLVHGSQIWMQDHRWTSPEQKRGAEAPPHLPTLWGCSPGHSWFLGCQHMQLGHLQPQIHYHLQVLLLLRKLLQNLHYSGP